MKPKENLFQLVKSLSKAEKRNFKLMTARYSGSKGYLQLFDAIENQHEYDEDEIRKMFSSKKFIKHLPRTKNYLYEMVLSSIVMLNANDSVDSELKHLSLKADILFKRGLYFQCKKIISKAKKIADENFKPLALLEVLNKEKLLVLFNSYADTSHANVKTLFDKAADAIDDIKNQDQYLYAQAILLMKDFNVSGENESLKQLEMLMDQDFLRSEKNVSNIRSKMLYNNVHYLYNYSITKNLKQSNVYAKRFVDITESNPVIIKESTNDYLAGLNNLIITYIQLGKYEKAHDGIINMRTFHDRYGIKPLPSLQAKVFVRSYNLELSILYYANKFDGLHSLINDIEQGFQKFKQIINKTNEITLLFNVAFMYFLLGQFKKSLKWINNLLLLPLTGTRQNIINSAKLLNLILHYEMSNFELLPYLAKSTREFLLKHNSIGKVEKAMLDFFETKIKSADALEVLRPNFVKLKAELLRICKHTDQKGILAEINFIWWLDSKIENKPFAEIVKRNGLGKMS